MIGHYLWRTTGEQSQRSLEEKVRGADSKRVIVDVVVVLRWAAVVEIVDLRSQ